MFETVWTTNVTLFFKYWWNMLKWRFLAKCMRWWNDDISEIAKLPLDAYWNNLMSIRHSIHSFMNSRVGGGDGETNAPAISIFWGEQIHTGLGPGHHGQTARKPFQQFMKGVSSKKTYHLPWWHWIFPNRREISMNNAHRARAFFKTLDSKQIPWLHKMCHWFLYHILLTKFIFNFW